MKISYECTELINELKGDIAEFGPLKPVEVIFTQRGGVVLAVDYNIEFTDAEKATFDLEDWEEYHATEVKLAPGQWKQPMKAMDALLLFAEENYPIDGPGWLADLLKEYSYYIRMPRVLENMKISSGNFSRFINGDYTALSEEKARAVFKRILSLPLKQQ